MPAAIPLTDVAGHLAGDGDASRLAAAQKVTQLGLISAD